MKTEHVWYLRCTEAPEITYALPISPRLITASNRHCVGSRVSNPELLIYGYETLFALRENRWSVTPLKQGKGISINGHTIESGKTTPLLEGDILEFQSGPKLVGEQGKESCKFKICRRIVFFEHTNCHGTKEMSVEEHDKENQGHHYLNAMQRIMCSAPTKQRAYQKYLSASQLGNGNGSAESYLPLLPKDGHVDELTRPKDRHSLKSSKTSLELVVRNSKSQVTSRRNPSKRALSRVHNLTFGHKIMECRVVLKDIGPLLGKRKKISVNLLRQKMKAHHWTRNEKKLLLQSRKANKFSVRVKSL